MLILCGISLVLSLKMNGQSISISKIKLEYAKNEKLVFEVINTYDSTKVYSVSLEKLGIDSSWFEVRSDVFGRLPTKKERLFEINGSDSSIHFFYPGRIVGGASGKSKYRLKINYGNDVKYRDQLAYSNVFILK